MGISVTDGEVKLRVKISGEYSFEGQLLNNENTYNLYLYHNGNLHKFNYEDSDTYMYTKKVKNGEDLNMEISFKTADEITSYKIFCIVYNDKDMLGENAEHNQKKHNKKKKKKALRCVQNIMQKIPRISWLMSLKLVNLLYME